jgi:hypothetical protein
MKRHRVTWGLALVITQSLLCGCGTLDSESSGTASATGPLLPMVEGNSWTYQVTEEGTISTKVTTVGASTKVGGSGPHKDDSAFKVTTTKKDGLDKTESWQLPEGDLVVRYRELSYSASTGELELDEHWDPHKLHIDGSAEHVIDGASWLEIYDEYKTPVGGTVVSEEARDRWTVEDVGASVTVPAGTFDDAIVFTKAGGTTLKTYWYVFGIGKVKETGGQTEELEEWSTEQ